MNTQDLLTKGVVEAIPEKELTKRLESDTPLTVKLGADPTRADLHLGHAVVLWKLRELQDVGHNITFIIGDFTTKIGDPTGKDSTRPVLSDADIEENAQSYFDQVGKILDLTKVKIVRNSEWLMKYNFADVISMARHFTIGQMLSHDTFRKRLDSEHALHLHEIIYPVVQAIDSVEVEADLEIGGTDQKFNILCGRQLQETLGKKPQCALFMPILTGLDGKEKMSKSLDNYVGINESANEMFGKLMSIGDDKMAEYAELCARYDAENLTAFNTRSTENPRDAKIELAIDIISLYHPREEAESARDNFINVFAKGQLPDDIPEFVLDGGDYGIIELLTKTELCSSNGDARRMIEQGAVKLNSEKVSDSQISVSVEDDMVLQVGKRKFIKIKI